MEGDVCSGVDVCKCSVSGGWLLSIDRVDIVCSGGRCV